MPASEAQILANRKNAALSTGPKTPEGKERSRSNALTHGLRASVLVHPDDEGALVGEAAPDPDAPGSVRFDGWLMGQMALTASKIDRCQEMEMAARVRVALRASVTWDEDRRLSAIRLASKLAKQPEEVVAGLRETLQGCDWLISRWTMLAHAAEVRGNVWTSEQTRLAYDLLGTPEEFREERSLAAPGVRSASVARRALEDLAARREILLPIDREARRRAEAGLSDDDAEVRRLRRYDSELRRRLKWTLGMLGVVAPEGQKSGSATEAAPDEGAPEPALESPRTSQVAPVRSGPALSKAERRLLKADSRREAHRRKLVQLRN